MLMISSVVATPSPQYFGCPLPIFFTSLSQCLAQPEEGKHCTNGKSLHRYTDRTDYSLLSKHLVPQCNCTLTNFITVYIKLHRNCNVISSFLLNIINFQL